MRNKIHSGKQYAFSKRTEVCATFDSKSKYPIILHEPHRKIASCYNKYNEKTGEWEEWHRYNYLPITKEYLKNHPNYKNTKSGYLPHLVLSNEEEFVGTMAHEFRHFWRSGNIGKRGRIWRAKKEMSERDASAYSIRKIREWRRLHAVDIYQKQPDLIGVNNK